ncbi:UrcA family protein [Qipengyuania marisflavi]|uniref:UrcA family protein n=1 Tax=Qipengyuania marisflavi TaxID=2486356 RepID=A0A5S3P5M4_9SPHN|nr:UrcA family protein [Qipengyuania marisflavi]TMM48226.1 UrcA family protein [Qipengyuania marisflavi]
MAKNLAIAAALGLALAAAPTPAFAQNAAGYNRDLTVTYTDIDLTKKSDRKALQRRLDQAARTACNYQEQRT